MAAKIRFESLALLTDHEIQTLLRQVEQQDLVVAASGATKRLRNRFFSNTSDRVRQSLEEEVTALGAVDASAVTAARQPGRSLRTGTSPDPGAPGASTGPGRRCP